MNIIFLNVWMRQETQENAIIEGTILDFRADIFSFVFDVLEY